MAIAAGMATPATPLSSFAIAAIEEVELHLTQKHKGNGFFTGQPRACRHHDEGKEASAFCDCPKVNEAMQKYI